MPRSCHDAPKTSGTLLLGYSADAIREVCSDLSGIDSYLLVGSRMTVTNLDDFFVPVPGMFLRKQFALLNKIRVKPPISTILSVGKAGGHQ